MRQALRTLGSVAWLTARLGTRVVSIGILLTGLLMAGIHVAARDGGSWQQAVDQMRAMRTQVNATSDSYRLRGVAIQIEGPEVARGPVEAVLMHFGATLVRGQNSERYDNRLVYHNAQDNTHYWELQGAGHRVDIERALREASLAKRQAWLDQRGDRFFDQALYKKPAAGPERYASLQTIMASSLLMLAAYVLVMLSGSMIGVEWDMDRTAGRLEPWTLASQPLWALYGGQALGGGLLAMAAMLVLMGVAKACGMGLSVPVGIALALVVGSASVLVGVYGVLGTMLFRHRFGRTFARLLLSPFNLMLIIGINWMRGERDPSWFLNLMEGRVGNWMLALELTGVSLGMLIMGALLVPIIEARIGVRRQGLRRL